VRLLVHLLYFTGQRLSDVLAMAWTDIQGDHVRVRQRKTGKVLTIRLHSALAAELKGRARDGVVICTDETGRPINGASARYRLQKFAGDHGHQIVPHGLRKNAVIALLEAGNSVAETAAISGQSYRMVEHYARQIDQKRLADGAILRWERNTKVQT
jgi:integrase